MAIDPLPKLRLHRGDETNRRVNIKVESMADVMKCRHRLLRDTISGVILPQVGRAANEILNSFAKDFERVNLEKRVRELEGARED